MVNHEVRSDNPAAMTHGFVTLQDDTDRLVVEFPSGAGFGPAAERDPALVRRDIHNGLVTQRDAY
jgi:N-methylhydantoinase B/oxoprolinase/acetone carboxylase alpha subunit